MTHDSLDSTCTSTPLAQRHVGWALPSLCIALSLACGLDPSNDGDPRAGSAGRGGSASAAGSTDPRAPASTGAPAPAGGVDAQTSTEGANLGDLANVGEAPAADGAAIEADAGSEAGEGSADAGTAEAPADAAVDPSLDENVVFIQQDGFQTTFFAQECTSVGEDGSVIADTEPLPVGDGRVLECITSVIGALATTDFLASTGERWCALGAIDTSTPSGDPRLNVQVADAPEDAPWTLVGTAEEPTEIGTVIVFGASAWPLWVDTHYAVIEVAPNPTGQLCDTAFGL